MSCWQCDLDIAHVCYHGQHNARWGLNDEAMAHLEAAGRHLRRKPAIVKPVKKPSKRR